MAGVNQFDEMRAYPVIRVLKPALRPILHVVRLLILKIRRLRTPYQLSKYRNLHLGCGPRHITGWANIDIAGFRNVSWDLRKRLPLADGSIHFIYTEHFIEHVTRPEALVLLRNCKAVLAKDGVIRISTPNLRRLVEDYLAGTIPVLPHASTWSPTTTCVMVNDGMRLWGHQFIYDESELIILLKEAGFSNIYRVPWGESEHPALRRLETRPYFDDIILEAT